MARLRASTAAQHEALEAWVDPARRFATREGYTRYLGEILRLFREYESALAKLPWNEIDFALEPRRKAPLIERDLRHFGIEPAPENPVALFPGLTSLAGGFGCLYVLEGSTLGGQYILRELEKQGITADSGGAFFACYGGQTQAMWKSFKEAATTYCADEARMAEAEQTARATFEHYQRGVSPLH